MTPKDGAKNVCLTMHQPWASLLVAGVKRVEGRSWQTTHRGRLWIHAAAKEPTTAEVSSSKLGLNFLSRTDTKLVQQGSTVYRSIILILILLL